MSANSKLRKQKKRKLEAKKRKAKRRKIHFSLTPAQYSDSSVWMEFTGHKNLNEFAKSALLEICRLVENAYLKRLEEQQQKDPGASSEIPEKLDNSSTPSPDEQQPPTSGGEEGSGEPEVPSAGTGT